MLSRRLLLRFGTLERVLPCRRFNTGAVLFKNEAVPKPKKVEEMDIEESFLKGSGPGGQKINKTSSAVQLKHVPTGLVVKVQDSRSRDLNRVLARKRLAQQIDLAQNGEDSWLRKKQDVKTKRKAKASQKSRAKYRRLEEEKLLTKRLPPSVTQSQNGTTGTAAESSNESGKGSTTQ